MKTKIARWFVFVLLAILLSLVPHSVGAAHLQQGEDPKQKADTLYDDGVNYFNQGDYRDALDSLNGSLSIYRDLGDQTGEATALHMIGVVYDQVGEYEQALDVYQQSLLIAQQIKDSEGEGTTLNNIGLVHFHMGEYSQSLDYFQRALKIAQDRKDQLGEGATLSGIAAVYHILGQEDRALDYYQQALTIARETEDRKAEGIRLGNMGVVYNELGQYSKALDLFQQALSIAQERNDPANELAALNNLGDASYNLNQYDQALNAYQKTIPIAQKLEDLRAQGMAFNRIGRVYLQLGQFSQAIDYYNQTLAIEQERDSKADESRALLNIAVAHTYQEQYQPALDNLQKALELSREEKDRDGEGAILSNMGWVYQKLNKYDKALEYDQQALPILKESDDTYGQAAVLSNLGFILAGQKQYEQALSRYQEALGISQKVEDRTSESIILTNIGDLYQSQGKSDQAMENYVQAVQLIEAVQSELKVDDLKASFLGQHTDTYASLINELWNQNRFQEAFTYAERARARAFLDQLAGNPIDFRSQAESTLITQEQKLQSDITSLRTQLNILRNRPQSDLDLGAIQTTQTELDKDEAQYVQLLTQMKVQSPETASLVSVDVASLADVQNLLDSNTTLVEYYVTEERTLAFVITHDTFETVTIKVSQDDLEMAIRTFRDFASLENPHPESLIQLWSWLIKPLEDKVRTPVVGIIPYGQLHYLPFAALTDGNQYFIDQHTLFTLPSASVLRFIKQKEKQSMNTLLALGNPATDQPGLAALSFAGQEVQAISGLYGITPLMGKDATETALRSQVGNASILHLAAHGEYDASNPLFSAIYLAPDSQNDGRLEVNEIYSLDLTKATSLVVLSACQSDVGSISAGDEVVGLNRAFIYAGAPTVVSSLWNIDDSATALLMETFYKNLKQGQSKAEALRQAQILVRSRYPHPYYWAAFELVGSPGISSASTPSLTKQNMRNRLNGLAGLVLLGVACSVGLMILVGCLIFITHHKRKSTS